MSLDVSRLGYVTDVTPQSSELRLPADPRYILVAKRAAAGFAALAGLDVEALDDLVIAVAQACEHAISLAERCAGPGAGQLKLAFHLADKGLEVQVRSSVSRTEVEEAARRRVAEAQAALAQRVRAADEMAMRVIGLFVDDFGYRFDERSGGMRVKLTKYVVR